MRLTTTIFLTMRRWAWLQWWPRACRRASNGALGRLGYLLWAGWSAASFKAFRLRVDDGRDIHRLWSTEARIANGRFHGGIELIESADLGSGELVVQAVKGQSLLGLGWSYLASVFSGDCIPP